ncbi:unnamed protein product [Thelazia callipaeda]|uniref:Phosphoprotein n=1 Tax=Thelazia callipaeda TaxID=103827 RepID=A0A0N5CXC6_THECL|nr:unnamed protein product [Thelazia callipaeda]
MDVIPDMDDLLNELEAAEASTEKVKLISDLVFHSNNVLLNTGNGLNIIQGDVSNLDHIGETAVSANILSAPKEPEKYLEYDVTSSKHLDNTEIAVRNEKSIICGEHGEKLESVPEKACISYLDSAEINDILNDIITSLTIMESNTSCNANISSTDSGLGERIHDYDDTAFRNSTTMKIKAMEYSDVADLAEEFGQISSVTHKADDKGVNVRSHCRIKS